MESVDTEKMTVNGLSYREYHQLHGCLPDEVIEHLLDLSGSCEEGAGELRKKLSEIADIVSGY